MVFLSNEISSEKRSKIMSHIKGKETSIEIKVRKYLYLHGFRYRKNDKSLPGTPDIVITKYRAAIFVNGFLASSLQLQICNLAKNKKRLLDS